MKMSAISVALGLLLAASTAAAQEEGHDAPGPFSLTMDGLVQTRYSWLKPEHADGERTFDVALAQLSLGGGVLDANVTYFFQLETTTSGDGNTLSLPEGWMQYRFGSGVAVKAGRIVLPYSRQFMTHPGNLLFSDLSPADYAFNLPRAVGVHVHGSRGRVGYDAAVAKSVRALDAGGHSHHDARLAVMGRVDVALLGSYGYLESAPGFHGERQLSLGIAAAYNPTTAPSLLQNLQADDRTTGLTLDAGYRDGRATLQSAYYQRRNDAAGRGLTDRGGYVQGGWYVVPGTWELAARVSRVDFAAGRLESVSGDSREYELGVNRYLRDHNVKVQCDAGLIRSDSFEGGRRDDRRLRVQFQVLF